MKLILLLFVVSTSNLFAQIAEYGKILKNVDCKIYISKNLDTLKAGDTLTIGIPTSDLGFTYISQGGQRVSNTLAGKSVIVDKLKSYGTDKSGYKIYAQFKGYGMLPVLIDYETAIELGEMTNPNAKLTRKQAIDKLKEAKELLDLGMLTIEKYEDLKNSLKSVLTN